MSGDENRQLPHPLDNQTTDSDDSQQANPYDEAGYQRRVESKVQGFFPKHRRQDGGSGAHDHVHAREECFDAARLRHLPSCIGAINICHFIHEKNNNGMFRASEDAALHDETDMSCHPDIARAAHLSHLQNSVSLKC